MDFERFVAERGRALERFAFVVSGDAHRAQDLTQIALLKAYRRWSTVTRADHPDPYVRRMVVNAPADWGRRRSSGERPEAQVAEVADREPDPAITRVLGCSEVTVRSHASRDLARLRALLHAEDVSHD